MGGLSKTALQPRIKANDAGYTVNGHGSFGCAGAMNGRQALRPAPAKSAAPKGRPGTHDSLP